MNTEFSEKKEIELINSIIREAIVHGSIVVQLSRQKSKLFIMN